MASYKNPFLDIKSKPGYGDVHVTLLPGGRPVYRTLNFMYPLKLISSSPHHLPKRDTDPSPVEDSSVHTSSNGSIIPSQLSSATTTTATSSNPPPPPSSIPSNITHPDSVPLLFLLSYGGGLLPPDKLDLRITLDPHSRLTITTQGSTKIYPSRPFHNRPRGSEGLSSNDPTLHLGQKPAPSTTGTSKITSSTLPANTSSHSLPIARQSMDCYLAPGAALCLMPDPTQPFRGSRYVQHQSFTLHESSSLVLLDWTTEGRSARGERWDALLWRGCNEVWRCEDGSGAGEKTGDASSGSSMRQKMLARLYSHDSQGRARRLQLRDHVILEADGEVPLKSDFLSSQSSSTTASHGHQESPPGPGHGSGSGRGMSWLKNDGVGVFGTLVIVGPLLSSLADFFIAEFEALPRIGARKWDKEEDVSSTDDDEEDEDEHQTTIHETDNSPPAPGTDEAQEPANPETKDETNDKRNDASDPKPAPKKLKQKKPIDPIKQRQKWRRRRQVRETAGAVLWTAARVRGLVMVKFTAGSVQAGRSWLGDMVRFEGSVLREFGPGGIMALR